MVPNLNQQWIFAKARPLFLACLLACLPSAAALAADAADTGVEKIPLVLLTITADHTGAPSLRGMPPLTDDLGYEYPFMIDGENKGRAVFSVQEIGAPTGTEPVSAGFFYYLDGESGQVSCTLNQGALKEVYLYRIVLPGLQCSHAKLTSPLGNGEFFIFEQTPAKDNTSLTIMASGGPVARLLIFDGIDLAFNLEIRGVDYPVNPAHLVDMFPANLITGETQLVRATLLDIYSFEDRHSYLERNPLPDPSQTSEPLILKNYELLIYPWADLSLWEDPELTVMCERRLKGGGSMWGVDAAGYENVVAVLEGPPGGEMIIGYIPGDVDGIDYHE